MKMFSITGTVEDLEALKGEDDDENEKDDVSAQKFLKKGKAKAGGTKSFTAAPR